MSTYEISKSSLLSLKAEILRKQQELSKAKLENEVKKKVLKNNPLDIKNKGIELREKNDQTDENEDLLKQSRSILEHKARLYDKLSSGTQSAESEERNKHYLVRFDKKRPIEDLPPDDTEPDEIYSESDDQCYESDEEKYKDPSEKWVDYVDCFGRTRRCMQKDLEYLKSKDEELSRIVEEKKQKQNLEPSNKEDDVLIENVVNEETKPNESPTTNNTTPNEESELLSSDMRREILRKQWENEEEELRNKSDIHYQDLLFGEARSHGVGYYGFSKDEEERAKQQEALRKLREETKLKQQKAQELRNSREKILAARLKAARNRKRARMGLPPEEEDEPTSSLPVPEEKQVEVEEITKKDRLLMEARKKHIRPWDIGKEGVKEHQIMTQEEWVEQKRTERQKEFAPPTNYRTDFRAKVNQTGREDTENDRTLSFTTKKTLNSRKIYETNTNNEFNYNKSSDDFEEIQQPQNIQPTPIEGFSASLDFDDTLLAEYNKIINHATTVDNINRDKGVEIAPPPTYDYYGPSQNKIRKQDTKQTNIHDSIEAGLKFLRKQVEEKEKSTKHPDDLFLF